jgi:hypothetical protein
MPIVLAGSTSGSTTIQATDAVTQTITLPNNTGTVLTTASTFGGTGPAFSVSSTALVSAANTTFTKVTYDTEDYDTNSNFASSRFTPTVAGYYQINATIVFSGIVAVGKRSFVSIYKNGSRFLDGNQATQVSGETTYNSVSGIVYLNGSTDYVEIYGYQDTGGAQNIGSSTSTFKFTGCLVRSA